MIWQETLIFHLPGTTTALVKVTSGGVKSNITGFNNPQSLTSDGAGDIYVADYSNNAIKEISAAGIVSTMISTGAYRSLPK